VSSRLTSELRYDRRQPNVDRNTEWFWGCGAVGATRKADEPGRGEIFERRRTRRFQRTELRDGLAIDGHDDSFAPAGAPDDSGHLVAKLAYTDALHLHSLVLTSHLL
jgi:hypothetical protein